MTDKTEAQPEALRLADRLDLYATGDEHQRDVEESAAELRRQHAEIQQLKAEKAEIAALNFENYEFQRKKADAATATVYSFHYAMKDAGWHPGRTDDDLTDIIRAKGRELAQLSARQAAPDGWRLVPEEPTEEMTKAGGDVEVEGDFGGEQVLFGSEVKQIYAAMLSAAPPQPEREPLTDEQIERLRKNTFSTDNPFCPCDRKTMQKAVRATERAHGIGATND